MLGIDPRAARAAWTVFLVAALLGMVWLARDTLFILILAIFLAYLVYPAVSALGRYAPRLSRPVAAALVFLVLIGVVVAVGLSIGQRVSQQAAALSERLPELLKDPQIADRVPLPGWMEPLRARIVEFVREQFSDGGSHAMSFAQRVGTSVLHFAGNLVFLVVIPILSFLLVKDAQQLHRGVVRLIPPGPRRSLWEAVLGDLNTVLAAYVRALLFLSIATFAAYAIVLSLIGVPYALVLAALAGPLEFIPVLGPLTAAAAALLVAAFSGYEHLVWIAVFLVAYRIFQDYVLSPYLMSEGIEIYPWLVIVGILAGEEIAGVPGMFLALPVLAAAKVIFERIRRARTAEADEPGPPRSGRGRRDRGMT
jgi:predicted PurR-regulated permease PerM